jgi:WD40 repeat protein
MRVLHAKTPRPLDLLAIGSQGHVAAACSALFVAGDVDVWDLTSGKQVRSLAFVPDGQHLMVSASKPILFVALRDGRITSEVKPDLGFPVVALSADGARLLATEYMNQASEVECWELDSAHHAQRSWKKGYYEFLGFYCPAISPDGSRVAVTERPGLGDHIRTTVRVRDAETGRQLAKIEFDAADDVAQLLFSADSTKLLARSSGRVVKVFDAATGRAVGELVPPGRPYVSGMAVHPNGTVACSRNNGTVCLWNLETRELVRTFDWKLGKLVSVAFSPDGTVGAAGTEDGRVVVWDVDP